MNRFRKTRLLIAAAWLAAIPAEAQPDPATQAIFSKLIGATIANDYDAFTAQSDAALKAALTKPMLEGVSEQIKGRAAQGYEAEYLGELKQQGHQVHLWRLRFKDGGDDVLATLSVKNGKAGGFYLR